MLELSDLHPMVLYKGRPALTPTSTFRANILTLSSLALPIIPGSKFEIYFKGLEVNQQTHLYFAVYIDVLIVLFCLFVHTVTMCDIEIT